MEVRRSAHRPRDRCCLSLCCLSLCVGFVTSLVINAAIALLAISFFIWARPKYPWCYDTRRNAKRRVVSVDAPAHTPTPRTLSHRRTN